MPAEPIEKLVRDELQKLIEHAPELKQRARHQIAQALSQVPSVASPDAERAKLEKERQKTHDQIMFVIDDLGTVGREAARKKVQGLEAKLANIDAALKRMSSRPHCSIEDLMRNADTLLDKLGKADVLIKKGGRSALERLLDLILYRCAVDPVTMTVEIEFRLPKWGLESPEAFCLDQPSDYATRCRRSSRR
ncbi:MAG: hypothetical protein WDZ31_02655 [Phycisphaeraceae bacterium]